MMSAKRALLLLALATFLVPAAVVAPGIASDRSAGGESANAHASALVRWQARWQTNFGPLLMRQSGRRVTGSYSSGNGHIAGRARGDTGRVLVGRWVQSGGSLRGSFRFTMSANGCRFRGIYRNDGGGGGDWSGRRLVARC
jgi:hypothetical protein